MLLYQIYFAHFCSFRMKMETAIASCSLLRFILFSYFCSFWDQGFAELCFQVRLQLFGLNGENKTLTVPVSEKAEVEGKCLEDNSEVSTEHCVLCCITAKLQPLFV